VSRATRPECRSAPRLGRRQRARGRDTAVDRRAPTGPTSPSWRSTGRVPVSRGAANRPWGVW